MFAPGEIVYGHVKHIGKPKYAVSIPATGERFCFPLRTTMAFDYGLLKDSEERLRQMFENPQVVCKLDDKEYIDLVYAMYSSKSTPDEYKP